MGLDSVLPWFDIMIAGCDLFFFSAERVDGWQLVPGMNVDNCWDAMSCTHWIVTGWIVNRISVKCVTG